MSNRALIEQLTAVANVLQYLPAANMVRRAAAALEAQEWQPIKTAPRDGRNIQVWTEELNTPECVYWGSEYGKWLIPDDHWDFPFTPTHWRPFPDLPQDGTQ